MQTTREQVVILRNNDGEIVGIVHMDMDTRHNLIYTVSLADMETIEDLVKCKDVKVKQDG